MVRRLLKNINLVNILLAGLLVALARYTLYPSPDPKVKVVPSQHKSDIIEKVKEEKERPPSSPADYMVIAEQNPFHPERKIPVEKKAEQPLPKPDFVLYGTLITDDLSIAYMEDLKSPVSTPGRGKRQMPLKVGQSLSGFTLKEIKPEKVVMVRGEEIMTVYLNDPNSPKKRETAVTSAPPGQGAVAPATAHATQKRPAASAQGEQKSTASVTPPVVQRDKPKEPLTPEQANKARDAFMKFFQRR